MQKITIYKRLHIIVPADLFRDDKQTIRKHLIAAAE